MDEHARCCAESKRIMDRYAKYKLAETEPAKANKKPAPKQYSMGGCQFACEQVFIAIGNACGEIVKIYRREMMLRKTEPRKRRQNTLGRILF